MGSECASLIPTLIPMRGGNTGRRATLKEKIYQEVRDALQAGKFEPGEAVTVKLFEQELGASIMPVRESLQRLVAEGALVLLPTGRVRVARFTTDEFEEITEMRLRLEGLAAHRAALSRTEEDMALIATAHEKLNALLRKNGAWSDVVQANRVFHFAIYGSAHAGHLLSMIDSLWLRVSPLLAIVFKMPRVARLNYAATQEQSHGNLVQAVRDQDARLAEASLREILITSAAWYHRHHQFDGVGR
jgi:DNA-binding GntR family transcriptional regulator